MFSKKNRIFEGGNRIFDRKIVSLEEKKFGISFSPQCLVIFFFLNSIFYGAIVSSSP